MGKINWTWELLEMSKMSSANRNRRNVETKEVDIAVYGNSVISVYAELTTDYGLYYTYIFDANSFNRTTNWGRGSSFSVYFSRLFFFFLSDLSPSSGLSKRRRHHRTLKVLRSAISRKRRRMYGHHRRWSAPKIL